MPTLIDDRGDGALRQGIRRRKGPVAPVQDDALRFARASSLRAERHRCGSSIRLLHVRGRVSALFGGRLGGWHLVSVPSVGFP